MQQQSPQSLSGSIIGALVAHVRDVAGDAGVAAMLERAGDSRALDDIENPAGWSTRDEGIRLFDAAVEVTGEPEVAKRVGESMLTQRRSSEVTALLRSLGSPDQVIANIGAAAGKYSTHIRLAPVEVSERTAVVKAWVDGPEAMLEHECLFFQGILSQVGPLFGLPEATVDASDCQAEGGEFCRYEVRWQPENDPAERIRMLEDQVVALTERFEALRDTATELVGSGSIDTLLEAAVRRAGLAVRAPRFLLAVRVDPDAEILVHHLGFESAREAEELGLRLVNHPADFETLGTITDRDGSTEQAIVVDVRSDLRRFGAIAALAGPGGSFFPQEQHLLAAYAGHAAAVLELSARLDESRRQAATSTALLDLAGALAEVNSLSEITSRIAGAVPSVVECDAVLVLTWDPRRGSLRLETAERFGEGDLGLPIGMEITSEQTPLVTQLRDQQRPRFLGPASRDAFVRSMLDAMDLQSVVLVPIAAHGELLGMIAVGLSHGTIPDDPDTLARVNGIAAHAAAAMANARLLETISEQALHDSLTGLPNTRLLGERAETAIAQARRAGEQVAVLFMDLDGFKPVNDEHGHAAGDEILQLCARRLRSALRESDTVARLGGDEFVVLLQRITSSGQVVELAERVLEMFAEPFRFAGGETRLTVSIGGALFPHDGEDLTSLLRVADAAMYVAKAQGPGRFALVGGG